MAWPNDARYVSYSANQQVKAAELNEFQDQIFASHANIDLLTGIKYLMLNQPMIGHNLGSQTMVDLGSGELISMTTVAAGEMFYFQPQLPSGANINSVKAKVYNADAGSAHTWTLLGYLADYNFDVADAATAPSGGSVVINASKSVGTSAWDVVSATGLDIDIPADKALVIMAGPNFTADDYCAAILIGYYPIG